MAAVANNPKFAKQVGIPQSVGKDYVEADKGRKFKEGGPMSSCGSKRMANGGKVATPGHKTGGGMDGDGMHRMGDGTLMKDSEHKMAVGGMAMGAGRGYKAGGKIRGCGVAQRGLTKGRMV